MIAAALLLAMVAAAWATPWAAAEPASPRLVAVPSATTVTVGEPFIVTVQAQAPAGTRWSFPAEVTAPDVTLKIVATPTRQEGALYQAAVFALDEATIPAITAAFELADGTRGEATSAPVGVTVASLLPEDPEEHRLAELRPPVSLPAGAPFWIALASVVSGLAGGLAWWWWRRRKTDDVAQPQLPQLPPAEEARAALRQLQEAGWLTRGELRAFYIQLVVIAKRYLERRLEAPVLEMTSTETAAFLRDHPVARPVAGVVRDLTGAADDVKFAGGEGDEARARRHWQQVWELVEGLERLYAVPAGEPLEKSA
jgi:hypothetical protein